MILTNKFIQSIVIVSAMLFSSLALVESIHPKPKTVGIPIRNGTYYLHTDRYIKIFRSKGNFCYWGTSKHGTTIRSLLPDSKN